MILDFTKPVYIFLDEGGDLTFDTKKGSRFFTLTGVLMQRPFPVDDALTSLRFDIMEEGVELEEFHATSDKQAVRDRVYTAIANNLHLMRIDSLVVEKRKAHPAVRDVGRFYPEMVGYLLRYIVSREVLYKASEIIIITDDLPMEKQRKAMSKAIKLTLAKMLPRGVKHRVMHHNSCSCCSLQLADYANWAIYRKWKDNDERSHKIISRSIKSEFDIYRTGTTNYY